MQRVTICQDSTHLPSEPYVSYKVFEQIIYNQQQQQLAFYGIPSIQVTGQAIGVKCLKKLRYSSRLTPWKRCPKYSGLLHAREPGNFGGGPVGCQNITAKKPESTRRTIFNQDSTLQLIVQISSGNVNSSVRARAKTHGRTPVLIELPRGKHLGSDACILGPDASTIGARMPASTLHESAQQEAPDAYISL